MTNLCPATNSLLQETILIFSTDDHRSATKTITQTDDGGWAKYNPIPATWFTVLEAVFDDLDGLLQVLKVLLGKPTSFIVRGALCRPVARGEVIAKRHLDNHPNDPMALLIETERRWVPVDLDDVPMGDDYDLIDVEGMIRKAIKRFLPKMFHDATVVWVLSAGAGTKSDGTLNCHLFFLADRPVGTVWLREFMKAFAPATDPSIYKFGQPIYTAAPIIVNGTDSVPTRLGIIRKSDDVVVMPDVTFDDIEEYAVCKGVGLLSHAKGFEAKLALMGHGDDALCGFHAPIREAAASYVSGKLTSEINIPALINRLKKAVAAAPKDRNPAYYEIYSQTKYLEKQITSGMAKYCRKAIKPFYPEGEPDLDAVRETLLSDVETALLDGVAAAANLFRPGKNFKDDRKTKVTMMQVGTGLGKTRSALLAIVKLKAEVKRVRAKLTAQISPLAKKRKVKKRELSDILDVEEAALRKTRLAVGRMARVVYAVPTHDLGEEVVERVSGFTAALWRGRGADDPEWDGNAPEAAKMCWRSSMLELLVECGIAAASMCKSKEKGKVPVYCPHYYDCGYQRQISRCSRADLVVVPHASLAHAMPAINTRDTLIIDESFWQGTLAGPIDVKLSRLRQWAVSNKSWQAIYGAVIYAPDGYLDMTALKLDLSDLEFLRGHLNKKPGPFFRPDWPLSQIHSVIKGAGAANDWRRQYQVLNNLIHARKYGHDFAVWVRKHVDVLKVTWRSPIRKGWQGKTTLLIDASLDPEIAKIPFPSSSHDFNIHPALFAAAPHVTALQVVDQPFGIRKFFDGKDQPRAAVGEMLAVIRMVSLSGPTLVIAQQKLEAELKQRGLPENVALTHFNAIRGIDRWKDVRNVVVIGRTAPTPMEIESLTEHLTGEPVTSSLYPDRNKFSWYMDREKGIRLSDGTGYAVRSDWHPDPMAERLRHQVADEEVEQGIERPRGVNRTAENPVNYYIMTNTVTRQMVQNPVLWEDIRPGKSEQMAAAGLVLFNAADMAAVYPDLWKNHQAVRDWKKGSKEYEVWSSLLYSYLIGNSTVHEKTPEDDPKISPPYPGFIRGRYQRAKPHAKKGQFWFHPDLCPDPKGLLTERLGELRMFEVIEDWDVEVEGFTPITSPNFERPGSRKVAKAATAMTVLAL
jgi:hypothetical protein